MGCIQGISWLLLKIHKTSHLQSASLNNNGLFINFSFQIFKVRLVHQRLHPKKCSAKTYWIKECKAIYGSILEFFTRQAIYGSITHIWAKRLIQKFANTFLVLNKSCSQTMFLWQLKGHSGDLLQLLLETCA